MQAKALQAAKRGYPNETCGLFYKSTVQANVELHVLYGGSTPSRIDANPDEVVQFVYGTMTPDTRLYGTFHTHPRGEREFSQRDGLLTMWGEWHAIGVHKHPDLWEFVWGKRVSAVEQHTSLF